ncbi:MAG TPA: AfsR/SARP family transcriptional regulator, partial [Actinospica sp.]|nr:AfsR/SARP family transcriptional regulator [Actinospica sp.]
MGTVVRRAGASARWLEVGVRFAVLGPLAVSLDDGTAVPIRGGQRRTLLAALLLAGGAPVSADRLADLLWGAGAPPPAGSPLHNQVARLRRALGDPESVRAVAPGYLIRLRPGELDLHAFAEHAADGRRALAEQDWPRAARRLAAALALWRGTPLAELPALAGDVRLRELEEDRLQVLQGRIEADLRLGRHPALLAELRELAADHPGHSAFHGQLMLALYRSGRRDEALKVFAAFSTGLRVGLGLEPSAELSELHARILAEDPALELAPAGPSASAATPAATVPGNVPRQLPADGRTFTG